MLAKTWAALAVALTLPFLHGCGNEDANKGQVRIVNATTAYPTLDLYTQDSSGNNDLVVAGTAAGGVSSYTAIDRGTYTFNIKSGTGAGVAATTSGTVGKGDHYTLVAYLTGNSLNTSYLTDEETAPGSGNAKLRIFNAAASEAPSVDVYLTTNACSALAITDTALVAGVTGLQTGFNQVTASATGTDWHVCVTAAGDKGTLRLDIPQLTLKDQEIATLILTRTDGGVLLNAALLDQQGALTAYPNTIARVRVVADAVAQATVSATVNAVSLTAETPSPSVGNYVTIPAGALTTSIAIGGVTTTGFTLPAAAAGSDYTLLVTGTAGAPAATLIADDNTPSTSTTQTVKVRVVNGVNGSTTASGIIDNKLVGTAAFGGASDYTTIPATTGTSTVRATTSGVAPTELVNQSFASGGVYTVFVYGDAAAPVIAPIADR